MTNKELVESFGWQEIPTNRGAWPRGRWLFEKDNYWLVLDERHRYKENAFVELMIRNPSMHMRSVGDDLTSYHFSFPFLGEATLHALNTLLPISHESGTDYLGPK